MAGGLLLPEAPGVDDDLDLDLEPIKKPAKPAPAAKPQTPPRPPAPPKPEAPAVSEAPPPAATALPARRRGSVARILAAVSAPFQSLRLPALNARTAACGLIIVLVLWELGANWAPVRVSILGIWHFDIPKALSFIIDVAIGVALAVLWQRLTGRKPEPKSEEPTDAPSGTI